MLKKKNNRGLALIVCIVMLIAMTTCFGVGKTQKQINNDIKNTQSELAKSKSKSDDLQNGMDDLHGQIDEIESDIRELTLEIAPLRTEIEKNEQKLDEQKAELADHEKNMQERLRNIYKNGTIGFADIVFSSKNVSDLLINLELVKKIYLGDKDVVTDLKNNYIKIESTQKELKEQKETLNSKLDDLDLSQEQLYDAYEQMKADKDTVDVRTDSLTAEITKLQNETPERPKVQKKTSTSKSYSANANVDSSASASGSAVVAYAMQFLGNPYVYGGTSLTSGCDCSGFTMKVYAHFGKNIPHYSESQPAYGTKVSNPKLGDLVKYPGHVGIYIGNGQLIHASNPRDGIKISNVNYRSGATYYRML